MQAWEIAGIVVAVFAIVAVVVAWVLLRRRSLPLRGKLLVIAAVVWLLSPIDPLPEFLGPLGLLDDAGVLIALVKYLLDQSGAQSGGPGSEVPVDRRVRDRRAVDAADWRISDDRRGGS